MERDEREQLKILQDPKFKCQMMLEKLKTIRDKRLLMVQKEKLIDKFGIEVLKLT